MGAFETYSGIRKLAYDQQNVDELIALAKKNQIDRETIDYLNDLASQEYGEHIMEGTRNGALTSAVGMGVGGAVGGTIKALIHGVNPLVGLAAGGIGGGILGAVGGGLVGGVGNAISYNKNKEQVQSILNSLPKKKKKV